MRPYGIHSIKGKFRWFHKWDREGLSRKRKKDVARYSKTQNRLRRRIEKMLLGKEV